MLRAQGSDGEVWNVALGWAEPKGDQYFPDRKQSLLQVAKSLLALHQDLFLRPGTPDIFLLQKGECSLLLSLSTHVRVHTHTHTHNP